MTKNVFEKTAFIAQEVNIMMFALRYMGFEINSMTGTPKERLFGKKDEVVALNTFKELKKGIDEEKRSPIDCELVLGSEQKELLVRCIEEINRGLNDLEHKINIIEKLQK